MYFNSETRNSESQNIRRCIAENLRCIAEYLRCIPDFYFATGRMTGKASVTLGVFSLGDVLPMVNDIHREVSGMSVADVSPKLRRSIGEGRGFGKHREVSGEFQCLHWNIPDALATFCLLKMSPNNHRCFPEVCRSLTDASPRFAEHRRCLHKVCRNLNDASLNDCRHVCVAEVSIKYCRCFGVASPKYKCSFDLCVYVYMYVWYITKGEASAMLGEPSAKLRGSNPDHRKTIGED